MSALAFGMLPIKFCFSDSGNLKRNNIYRNYNNFLVSCGTGNMARRSVINVNKKFCTMNRIRLNKSSIRSRAVDWMTKQWFAILAYTGLNDCCICQKWARDPPSPVHASWAKFSHIWIRPQFKPWLVVCNSVNSKITLNWLRHFYQFRKQQVAPRYGN